MTKSRGASLVPPFMLGCVLMLPCALAYCLMACGTGRGTVSVAPAATGSVEAVASSTPAPSLPNPLTTVPATATIRDPIECMRPDFTADEDCFDDVFFSYFLRDVRTMQDLGLPVVLAGT